MKKTNSFIVMLLLTAVLFSINSCKKDDPAYTCTTCATSPEAKVAFDNNSGGIYKGVMIGSTGTIKFNVANDGSAVFALLTIDGDSATLTSNVTWDSGFAYLAPFTGTLGGNAVSITFSVDLSGANPTVSSANIPGHPNATFSVYKETSNSQVVCFEGTFTGTDEGVFNMVLSTTLKGWKVITRENGKTSTSEFTGTVNNNVMNCTSCSNGVTITGTLDGDEVSGNWANNSNGGSGSWTGKKTM